MLAIMSSQRRSVVLQVDATLFGFLAQIIYVPIEAPHKDLVENECKNIVDYCERIRRRYWPDWDEACGKQSLHTQWKRS